MSLSNDSTYLKQIPNYPFPADEGQSTHAVTVFAGSHGGNDPAFSKAARSLGKAFAEHKVPVVTGGGNSGLMFEVMLSALENGGRVHGVCVKSEVDNDWSLLPKDLPSSVNDTSRYTYETVRSVAERQYRMAELSGNGFIALAGGAGTLDEIHTMMLFNNLDYQNLPVLTLSVKGEYDNLHRCHETVVESGFMKRESKDSVSFVEIKVGQTDRSGETAISELQAWHKENKAMPFDRAKATGVSHSTVSA